MLTPDLARYLARQGLQQGPLPGSTTPHQVGYARHSEPDTEEAPMPQHVSAVSSRPTWAEASRSTVTTVTVALAGQPDLRDSAEITGRWFSPRRMRLAIGQTSGRPTSLLSARITGPLAARVHHQAEVTLVLPLVLGGPGWPDWVHEIVLKIIDDIEGGTAMGGKEDAGTKDAREELEKLVTEEEKRQGK